MNETRTEMIRDIKKALDKEGYGMVRSVWVFLGCKREKEAREAQEAKKDIQQEVYNNG